MKRIIETFGHTILTSEIIGISPLYMKPTEDAAMWSLYGARQLHFKIFTKQNSIEIRSDFFKPASMDEKEAADEKKAMNGWKDEFVKLQEKIKAILTAPKYQK